jgi:hypothetical protein
MPRALSPAFTFALFAGLAAYALTAFSPAILNDGDTYWHIRAGEWMILHGAVLRTDPFSYTVAGAPWHTAEWLAEIIMAQAWRAGWPGVHLLFAASAGVTAGVVGYFVRRRTELVPALLATVLGLSCITGSLLARPHMLVLPLLAIWTAGLVSAREKDRAPSWWLIPVIPLWANLHGSFAFGLVLAGGFALEAVLQSPDRKKAAVRWGLFLLAAVASALITPFGIEGLLFPLRLTAMQGIAHIGEWQATDFSHTSPFEFALLASLVVMGSGKLRVPLLRLMMLAGLTYLALTHARHQMLLGVCAPLMLAPSLARTWPKKTETTPSWLAIAAGLGLLLLTATRLALPITRGDDSVTPATALAHVPRFVRETPVLNDYSFGSWLIWNGVRPFIDSRADLYGDIFLRNYADITAPDKDALASTLAYYHVRWTIFSANAPVVKLLDATPGWHRFYTDKLAVVHVHD